MLEGSCARVWVAQGLGRKGRAWSWRTSARCRKPSRRQFPAHRLVKQDAPDVIGFSARRGQASNVEARSKRQSVTPPPSCLPARFKRALAQGLTWGPGMNRGRSRILRRLGGRDSQVRSGPGPAPTNTKNHAQVLLVGLLGECWASEARPTPSPPLPLTPPSPTRKTPLLNISPSP